jgi:hypothetical protein
VFILSPHDRFTTQWPHHGDNTNQLKNPGVNNHPAARETTDSRHHGLHLLRHICREISTVRSSSLRASSVPVHPRTVAPQHQSNTGAGRTAFRVARRTEGLLHLATGLQSLPALHSLPLHCYSSGRLYAAGRQFSACPHRPRRASSEVSKLHILPHRSRPLHGLARSHPHP